MKNIKTILIAILFICTFLITQTTKAQTKKISKQELPAKIKETLKNYPDYKMDNQAVVTTRAKITNGKKSKIKEKVFRFKLLGNRKGEVLVINEQGKVVALENGESN